MKPNVHYHKNYLFSSSSAAASAAAGSSMHQDNSVKEHPSLNPADPLRSSDPALRRTALINSARINGDPQQQPHHDMRTDEIQPEVPEAPARRRRRRRQRPTSLVDASVLDHSVSPPGSPNAGAKIFMDRDQLLRRTQARRSFISRKSSHQYDNNRERQMSGDIITTSLQPTQQQQQQKQNPSLNGISRGGDDDDDGGGIHMRIVSDRVESPKVVETGSFVCNLDRKSVYIAF